MVEYFFPFSSPWGGWEGPLNYQHSIAVGSKTVIFF
jgi:hypothetical protein